LYCGEQYDSHLSQYYLRARYYDPANGRFNQLDPFGGNNSDPQSLHKYLYVHNNPVNGIDSSGNEFSIVSTLNNITIQAMVWAQTTPVVMKALYVARVLVAAATVYGFFTDQEFRDMIFAQPNPVGIISGEILVLYNSASQIRWIVYGAMKFPKASNLIARGVPRYVFRVIRPTENPAYGLSAKSPGSTFTPEKQVRFGGQELRTNWISATTKESVARNWAAQTGNRIVRIDLSKVSSRAVDLASPTGRVEHLKHSQAIELARESAEILIENYVPAEAVELWSSP
jgi:RHS repeat-associated protein